MEQLKNGGNADNSGKKRIVRTKHLYISKFIIITMTSIMKCKYCLYSWKTKKDNPVSCPRCKRRYDYPIKLNGGDLDDRTKN